MKRKIVIVIIAIIAVAILVIVFFKPSGSEKININILGEDASTIRAMMSLEKEYEAKNPTIDLIFLPNTFDDAFNKSNQDFTNKTGLYDIVMQYNFSLSSFVRNGYVYGIDELIKEIPKKDLAFEKDLFQNVWKETSYYYENINKPNNNELKKYGYPFAANSMVLMYNATMFNDEKNKQEYFNEYNKELNVPKSWEDFYNVAKFFTNKEKGTYGVCMEGVAGPFLYADWVNFHFGMGGKIMNKEIGWQGDENTQMLLDSDAGEKALAYYVSLKPFNNGNYTNVEQFEQMRIMKEGNTTMAIVWTDMIYQNIKTEDGFDNRFKFDVIPGNKSIYHGGAYFINRHSKHPQEASKYIIDLLQPENQILLARKGLCSASKKVYEDTIVSKLPYANALLESLNRGAIFLEAGPDSYMISEVISNYVQKCWNGELSPSQALSQAQREIENKRKEVFEDLSKTN
ncbi:MAG: extracellular solute-binding protein [Salinivirgaceae bacterium]